MRFADRTEAGRRLAAALAHLKGAHPAVFALPRGGVPVAAEVARALAAPLDLVLVRKLGAPGNPEFAVGAVAEGTPPARFVDAGIVRALGVPAATLAAAEAEALREIERRRALYLAGRPRIDPAGRCAILVDDGLATGATMRAAIAAIRACAPARLVLAVPVAPQDTLDALRAEVDEAVCLLVPDPFHAVGAHYLRFPQLEDAEVIALLDALSVPGTPGAASP